ncbi:hypothetical protein OH491_26725 [Termitidicoccus mucosus]|uniref:Uncharacterized protein n=1 Tax=Termitidicoccus mucosus TaxID=1184151 RepID=A0A178IBH6_9BACT|nr:hypothetical protein AW736_24045 [Opitutaceae bacterium TSB47]
MADLRYTETNAADDSAGRVFGLDGNLYLPVLLAMLGALALFAILTLVFKVGFILAGFIVAVPLVGVLGWILLLKQGKPAGYDRDLLEQLLSNGNFTRIAAEQGRVVE